MLEVVRFSLYPVFLRGRNKMCLHFSLLISLTFLSPPICGLQHPFIKSAKPNSILRALITDAMEIKLKRQEEAEQREQEGDDDDNSVQALIQK